MAMPSRPLNERFDQYHMPEPNSGCWIWFGSTFRKGYGSISEGGRHGRTLQAHRVSYERFKGPIAPGLTIDHLCRTPCCVNPDHLEAVTLH
jgi:hypothetical protein